MKKALIHVNRVAQVVAIGSEFPVAPPLIWFDCMDDVTPETHFFNGSTIVPLPLPPAPPLPDPRVVADEAERAACKADAAILILINQTRAEWATWAGTNFPTLTAPERARIGVICWMLAVAIRRLMRSF